MKEVSPRMNKSKRVTEGAILTAIFIVILASTFIPLLSMITIFLLPVPLVIFTYRHGWKPALVMAMASFFVAFIFTNIVAIPLTLPAIIGGIVIGDAVHKKRSAYETWAQGTAGLAVALVIGLLFTQLVFDINFSSEIDQQMNNMIGQFEDVVKQLDMGEEMTEQLLLLREQIDLVKNLIPLAIVMGSLIHAFISQWASYKVINRLEQEKFHFPPFRNLAFPTAILWVYLISMLLALTQPDPEGMFYVVVQNIMLLASILILIQGVSFIFYYLHIKKLSPALSVIGLVLALFFAPIVFPLLRILGIIDIGFKLRERLSNSEK